MSTAILSLTDWRLGDFDTGGGDQAGTYAPGYPDGAWISCPAPGDAYLALVAAGRLRHPYEDRAEEEAAWVTGREWWQRCTFTAPSGAAARHYLVFHGLDTFATIWLNGEELARTDNMFRAYEFDVTDKLQPGANTIAVRFDPPAVRVADTPGLGWGGRRDPLHNTKRNLIRKAQFGWGWDWGPTLPTVGIWRPVELRSERVGALQDVAFETLRIEGKRARVRIKIAARMHGVRALRAEAELRDADGRVAAKLAAPLSNGAAVAEIDVDDARLWWTHDLGAPHLYDLRVTLFDGGEEIGTLAKRVGIRTIALDTSPDADEPGTNFFRFILNGAPLFAKGACWIPASNFVGALTRNDYAPLIEASRDANMNMLRIWGGGIYEHDAFYDLCDELGLLIWQDFMFACAPYPEDAPFAANVSDEVAQQIKRLRSHPSMALWCGNNENQFIREFTNDPRGLETPLAGNLYYDEIIPKLAAELDPTTPYWPGSPFGGPRANSMRAGDVHDWTVWHGLPPVPDDKYVGVVDRSPKSIAYTRYAENQGRFISEFGLHASPVMASLERCLPEDQRTLYSEGLVHRIKDQPKDKVRAILEEVTGQPTTLREYVDFTQFAQAEGLKFGIEHFRRRTPHCSGALIWQLNDCWPGVSWSLMDSYGSGKASLFYMKRVFAPLLASFKIGEEVELWLTNDRAEAASGEAIVELIALDGGEGWSETVPYSVGAFSSTPVWRCPLSRAPHPLSSVLRVRSTSGAFDTNRALLAPFKDLQHSATPPLEIRRIESAGALELQIMASAYTFFVHVETAQADAKFSDNYFDLASGETRSIRIAAKDSLRDTVVRSL